MIIKYYGFLLILVHLSFEDCLQCKHQYIEGGAPGKDQKLIVKKHNELRKLIADGKVKNQPKGTNLKRMKWDAKLAETAQNIADLCVFAHVKVEDDRWQVGQNLHISKSSKSASGTDWDAAIQSWFNEHEMYTYGTERIKGTGHYTQVVWAETEYVGCGYSYYIADGKTKYNKLYVCNYGPAGNIIHHYPYKTDGSGCKDLC